MWQKKHTQSLFLCFNFLLVLDDFRCCCCCDNNMKRRDNFKKCIHSTVGSIRCGMRKRNALSIPFSDLIELKSSRFEQRRRKKNASKNKTFVFVRFIVRDKMRNSNFTATIGDKCNFRKLTINFIVLWTSPGRTKGFILLSVNQLTHGSSTKSSFDELLILIFSLESFRMGYNGQCMLLCLHITFQAK